MSKQPVGKPALPEVQPEEALVISVFFACQRIRTAADRGARDVEVGRLAELLGGDRDRARAVYRYYKTFVEVVVAPDHRDEPESEGS